MNLFVNKRETCTAVCGSVVYEVECTREQAFAIVETWLRGQPAGEFDKVPREYLAGRKAVEALIKCQMMKVGNRIEMESRDDDRLRILNGNVNPSGRAPSNWAYCR